MSETISFGDSNNGFQMGVNHGSVTNNFHTNQDILDKLPAAYGAEFDSYVDQHEDQCLAGTRTELLQQIMVWAASPHGKTIFWLNGMAGTGKSTIARTIAYSLKDDNLLGATFFFKRGEGDRGSALKLFPTLARQLALKFPWLASVLTEVTRASPDIGMKALREQFDKLMIHPLTTLKSLPKDGPSVVTIILDALDECERDDDIKTILHLLPQLQNTSKIKIRILLTSRPELPIRLGFSKMEAEYENLVLHEIPEEVTAQDITLYLRHRLSIIRKEAQLPEDWPSDKDVEAIVKLSVPLFIFAATICRVLEDPLNDPIDSLDDIVAQGNDGSQLAGTYLPVLDRILKLHVRGTRKEDVVVEELRYMIGGIVLLENPLPLQAVSKLLGIPERLFRKRLNALHSVIHVSADESIPIRPFHLSFRDFLLDPEVRDKTPFWVDEDEVHRILAIACLSLCKQLKRNICGLSSPATLRTELSSKQIEQFIPFELQYACRFWASHLVRWRDSKQAQFMVMDFLEKNFLYWMEAMSILGYALDIVVILRLLEPTFHSSLLDDAKRFVLKNWQTCNMMPLQTYYSGLFSVPSSSEFDFYLGHERPDWEIIRDRDATWGMILQKIEGHTGRISSLAFSPDERFIASSSFDATIKFWDIETGTLLQTIETLGEARSSSFSPDGKILAFVDLSWGNNSHSESKGHRSMRAVDDAVFLLDIATGALQEVLSEHNREVNNAMFLPVDIYDPANPHFKPASQSQMLIWSSERAITIWNLENNCPLAVLEGRFEGPLAFSKDGKLLAVSCVNRSVHVYNTNSWTLSCTTEQFNSPVRAMGFSPSGALLVVDSVGKLFHSKWPPIRGFARLLGTSEGITSFDVSYKSNVATARFEEDVVIQSLEPGFEGEKIAGWNKLKSHIRPVTCLKFSPSGSILATGSSDRSVSLWSGYESESSGNYAEYEISSIKTSNDGDFHAGAFPGGIVGVWRKGADPQKPLSLDGHRTFVKDLAFARNSRLLVTASSDNIKIWDAEKKMLPRTFQLPLLGIPFSGILAVAWAEEDQKLVVLSDQNRSDSYFEIAIWETTSWKQIRAIDISHLTSGYLWVDEPDLHAVVATFSPQGDRLTIGKSNGLVTLNLWPDIESKELQVTNRGANHFTSALEYSQDGKFLAVATSIASIGGDVRVELWDTDTGQLLHILRGSGASSKFMAFSGNDSYLHTHLGTLSLEKWRPEGHYTPLKTGFSMHDDKWVAVDGEKTLLLPVEYRPKCVSISNGVLAIGSLSGLLIFRQKE